MNPAATIPATQSPHPSVPFPTRERVELILNQVDQLPTLPAVVTQLLAVTTSDESSVRDVVRLVELDASLTSAVLREARSAHLGARNEATTVQRAVSLLGFRAVRNMVLAAGIYSIFEDEGAGVETATYRRELWTHNLAVGCVSEQLAAKLSDCPQRGWAFVGGLLHDIGKIALDACLPRSYARVVARAEQEHRCSCDVERDLLGLDHMAAGKRLAVRWGMPQPVIDCIWLHHQSPESLPPSVAHRRLVTVTHLADNLVRQHGIGCCGYRQIEDAGVLAKNLGLDAGATAEVMDFLPARMESFGALVPTGDAEQGPRIRDVLLAANRKLGRLNAELMASQQPLRMGSNCFQAVHELAKALRPNDGVSDVCLALAERFRILLGIDCVLALAKEAAGRCVNLACARGDGGSPIATVIDPGDAAEMRTILDMIAGSPNGAIVKASEPFDYLWRACGLSGGVGLYWLFVLPCEEGMDAALVFRAEEWTTRPFADAVEELKGVARTFGLALCTSSSRARAERTSEELLHVNRKLLAAQEALLRTRSISMIAEMAAGAAHELNNPLSVISGRAQMALSDHAGAESARLFEIIVTQAKRASDIVADLMGFAKPPTPSPELKSLAVVLESLRQGWEGRFSLSEGELDVSLPGTEMYVYADLDQLGEIMDAVMANAIQATAPEQVGQDRRRAVQVNSRALSSDEMVRIVVEDNGVGMSPDVLRHAPDPFFSNRPAGRGRGLGLSRAFRFAEVNGGRLWLESNPGVGTTVYVDLPGRAR